MWEEFLLHCKTRAFTKNSFALPPVKNIYTKNNNNHFILPSICNGKYFRFVFDELNFTAHSSKSGAKRKLPKKFSFIRGLEAAKQKQNLIFHSFGAKLNKNRFCLFVCMSLNILLFVEWNWFFSSPVVQQIGDIPWAQSTHAHFDFIHKKKSLDSFPPFFRSLNYYTMLCVNEYFGKKVVVCLLCFDFLAQLKISTLSINFPFGQVAGLQQEFWILELVKINLLFTLIDHLHRLMILFIFLLQLFSIFALRRRIFFFTLPVLPIKFIW